MVDAILESDPQKGTGRHLLVRGYCPTRSSPPCAAEHFWDSEEAALLELNELIFGALDELLKVPSR